VGTEEHPEPKSIIDALEEDAEDDEDGAAAAELLELLELLHAAALRARPAAATETARER